jgi:hypothetical protein
VSLAYAHPAYAASLSTEGTALELPRAGGHLIVRGIPGGEAVDAAGPYPFFMCERWDGLASDLAELDGQVVSVVLVADPLGGHRSGAALADAFPDVLRPYKPHYLVDLREGWQRQVSAHHRRNAARGLERLDVDIAEEALPHLDEWASLYERLVERHAIAGVARFSRETFAAQLAVPGVVLMRALEEGRPVGACVWYRARDRAYYHLAAYTDRGYDANAAHALFWTGLHWLAEHGIRRVNLGGGMGPVEDPDDGLVRFKRGWATTSEPAWLCGRVCDPARYEALGRGRPGSAYFPAYRAPAGEREERARGHA